MEYNIADLFESVVDAVPENMALACGDVHYTFAELDRRANRMGNFLKSKGIGKGDHVGLYLYNGHEFVESLIGVLKIRGVGININYRFVAKEVRHMITDADLKAIICHSRFIPIVEEANQGLPPIEIIAVDDGHLESTSIPVTEYEAAMVQGSEKREFEPRSADDLFIVYTGGTTGMPKGVMWRQEDVFFAGLQGGAPSGDPIESPEELATNVKEGWYTVNMLPCAPFIHGSAQFTAFICLFTGGKLTVQPGRSFDAARVLELIKEEEVSTICIVGDAMAIPLLDELNRDDKQYDTENLVVVASAGAILSPTIKENLQAKLPDTMFINSFGTTESGDLGRAAEGEESHDGRPTFYMDENVVVLDENWEAIEPGSEKIGKLARSGRVPLGYYKDPEKTAERFVEAQGKRWVVPGDFATVEADGRITFMGRGSKCINTGGEKVFPEEVEEALKAHADIIDALVVGVPDRKWGNKVAAVFNTRGNKELSIEEVQQHCREHVAGYKVPRLIVITENVERMPSGKPDYKWAEQEARQKAEVSA